MASFGNQFLDQLTTGDQIKDYRHATKTFVDSLYRLGPKSSALFHVFIDVNNSVSPGDPTEIGMLAKSVQLPKFSVQNKTYNAYNRKNIVQERINYDPISLTFHDDSADVIRNFWYGYYSHYYRDSDHTAEMYGMNHKYASRHTQAWGYSPRSSDSFISSIRIYSLHQKSFSSYILFKPTITNFQHGQHTAGNYDLMEHSMTVNYEAVHYETGAVSNGTVLGFGEQHYDKSPSPLSAFGGSTQSILGPGGLVEGASGVITNLQNGNLLGAAVGAFQTYKKGKNMDLKAVAGAELKQVAMGVLRGNGVNSTISAPTSASIKKLISGG
jgi:hypothetical protein